MAKKHKNKSSSLTGGDILIAVLIALAGSIAFMTVTLVVGSIMFPETWERSTVDQPPAASQPVRGTFPSSAPASTRTPTPAPTPESTDPSVDPSAEPSNEPEPEKTDEPIQQTETPTAEPSQAPASTQTQPPAPAQTKPPAPAQTQAPAPTQTRVPVVMPSVAPEQNPKPVASANPTAPPVQQTQVPSQSGGNGSGWDTERFDRPDWPEGKYLAASTSNKYHCKNCSTGAARIRLENEIWFDSEDDAIAAGYSRCGICWR